jgi:predicted dehydrogenase
MKILIAGLGSIGRRHLRNLLELGEGDILLYRSRQSTLPDEELSPFPTYMDLEEALAQRPDSVVISNPTSLHLDVAIPAARQGCHLLFEKPVSHSFDRVDELQQAVRENEARVLVGFQFRFHPGLRYIADLLQEGDLGRPLWARAHWGEHLEGWHPWEDYRRSYSARADLGGGVIHTLCHPLDYLGWFFGPVAVVWANKAHLSKLELQGVEDTADISLGYRNGVFASVHLDYIQKPSSHNLMIVCEEGTLLWDNLDGAVRVLRPGMEDQVIPAPEGFERNWSFIEEMKHFLAVARGEEQSVCTLEDGIEILKLTLAAHASSDTGSRIDMANDRFLVGTAGVKDENAFQD